jgi:hypothetical protein
VNVVSQCKLSATAKPISPSAWCIQIPGVVVLFIKVLWVMYCPEVPVQLFDVLRKDLVAGSNYFCRLAPHCLSMLTRPYTTGAMMPVISLQSRCYPTPSTVVQIELGNDSIILVRQMVTYHCSLSTTRTKIACSSFH